MADEFYDKPTGAKPKTVMGVVFQCYRAGILRYEWRSENGRFAAGQYGYKQSFYAKLDGQPIAKRFRKLETAMQGAITLAAAKRSIAERAAS